MALQGLDLRIEAGKLIAIIGSSGSGKSTFLNILGGLDSPSAGKIIVGGWNLSRLNEADRIRYKRVVVGFVWQNVSRNLIPYLTALENVELPMILNGKLDKAWARELLEVVGLKERMNHRPNQMSGGQQQRVAIAIGLANRPQLLLADEPTGSLDTQSAHQVLEVFRAVRQTLGVTVVVVTHDRQMAKEVDRCVQIRDGKVATESVRRSVTGLSFADEENTATHDEYVVLDSAGRLQIPATYRKTLGIASRARISMRNGEIVIQAKE
ncbi:MAG TPA: ABC transporter ATP-binding protein [Bacillota bacterium]|nr:ABC transporter ATP-binding protein [Bacillota bacterium]